VSDSGEVWAGGTVAGLSLRNVVCSYGAVRAVDEVSFDIMSEDIVGLIGPNGSGKTTLLAAVAGDVRVRSGSVKFFGRDITRQRPDAIARLGLVRSFQQPRMFASATVRENVSWACDIAKHSKTRGASAEGVANAIEMAGLTSVLDKPAVSLTTGQLRSLGLVLALTAGPRLLLLDEPAAGLSSHEGEALRRLLSELPGSGMTVVVVDHDMSFLLPLVSRLLVLSNGRLIADGSPDCVVTMPEVLEVYLGRNYVRDSSGVAEARSPRL
jgi:ABC-type branched-subunit amino acid transport system ATPase component